VSAGEQGTVVEAAGQDELIRVIQAGVPFARRPFARIADDLGSSEEAVLAGLRALSEQGILREISAVLEGSALGYDSALVAGVVPEADIERVAKIVSTHPTVTHNYLRNHAYNLWFTVAVPRGMSLERTLSLLSDECGVAAFQPLRRTLTFKIGVNFDPKTRQNASAVVAAKAVAAIDVGEGEKALFRALQTPLPIIPQPFDELAETAGVEPEELLAFARSHLGGAIRRYVGTLRHRKLGVRANGMVVWCVPEERAEAVGQQLANASEVSHCYARNAIVGFPYTHYSMIHGPDRDSCIEVAAQLSRETGIDDYAVLFSEREFKKVRLRYFLPELDQWWTARAGS
jgi:DNA-binding Lrp family transcriptional regulator